MSFTNITDEELVGMGVTGLPDTPGLTTEEMQAQFDEYSVFLKDKFKTLISELEAATAALNIGAEVPQNITADGNIQSILEGLRQYVDDTVVAIGTGDMATAIYDPDRDGIIAPAQGGTGQTSLQAVRNAMGLGDTTGALPIANGGTGQTTAAGVRNALGLGETTGALPIANGGTGQTTAAGVRNALGLGNTTGALPVANGGTGKSSISAGTVLVGNGTDTPSERGINSTSGGVENSDSLTTAGALYATKAAMQATFQDGVDTIYNAIVAEGVTLSESTPSACATGVHAVATNKYNAGRSQGRQDVKSTNVAAFISDTYGGEHNYTFNSVAGHYYSICLFTTTDSVESFMTGNGISVTNGANEAATRSAISEASNGTVGYMLLEATGTSITIHKIAGYPIKIMAVELGLYE